MKIKKVVWWIRKIFFLDDILGLLFAIAAIAGVALIAKHVEAQTSLIVALCVYIPVVTFIGVYGTRKLRQYLDPDGPRNGS